LGGNFWDYGEGVRACGKIENINLFKPVHKMNKLEYYNRQKELWDDKEIQDVRMEYETNEMTISQIADIHRRTPGSISYKLKGLGIVIHNTLTRGYLEYRNSNLYKEILEVSKRSDAEKKVKREERAATKEAKLKVVKAPAPTTSAPVPSHEIAELRNEVASLKRDVKEMLRLMNALYEFESA
jgi:hypothetical protein